MDTQVGNPTGMWWYLIGRTKEGKRLLIGPKTTKQEALNEGFRVFGDDFETVSLNTRDFNRAKSMLKAKLLGETADISDSLQKIYKVKEEE